MWRFGGAPQEPVVRPSDPAVRRANLLRIVDLFRPYKPKLSVTLLLILFSAGISVISPFLLRAVLDTAIPDKDLRLLTWLVVGMVAIAVVSQATTRRSSTG